MKFRSGKNDGVRPACPPAVRVVNHGCGERLAELAVTSGGDEGALNTCLSPRLFIRLFNGKVASCMQHFMYSIPMFPYRPVLF